MAAFLTKWLQDVRDDQAADGRYPDFAPNPNAVLGEDRFFGVPAWGDAGTVVPWRVYQNYADTRLLEQHYANMQDIEFTIEKGKLWMLQTRDGKRTARAAVRIAVDMVEVRKEFSV